MGPVAPPSRPGADPLRARLEGGAEVLEAALARLTPLRDALDSLRWRARLEALRPLLGEAVHHQPEVDAVLARARKRAAAEAWPPESPTGALLQELEHLLSDLARLAGRRLSIAVSQPLAQVLAELERRLPSAPRLVLPSEAAEVAARVLPASLPALAPAARLGTLAEAALTGVRLADEVSLPALARLEQAWAPGLVALETLWRKLEGLDPLGSVPRHLRKAARGAQPPPPHAGPAVLVHALHWRDRVQAAVDELFQRRLAPAAVAPSERFEAWRWLVLVRSGTPGPAAPSPTLTRGRAAVLDLALALGGNPSLQSGGWEPLVALGRLADAELGTKDWRALADALDAMLRALAQGASSTARPLRPAVHVPSPVQATDTLEGRLELVRRLLGA